jgi:thiol:disulfide interchange protein DsbC
MRKVILFLSLIQLLFSVSDSYAFSSKGQDCLKCHTLKKEEASALLKNFDKDLKVLNVNISSVKYLWEVSVETNGKKGIVYIDLPKKHIFSGTLIEIHGKKNLTDKSLSEINRTDVSRIPLKDALVIGKAKATHKVIVFDDPE